VNNLFIAHLTMLLMQKNLGGFSPQANYTYRATASCQLS
jgi:hypothetical protein